MNEHSEPSAPSSTTKARILFLSAAVLAIAVYVGVRLQLSPAGPEQVFQAGLAALSKGDLSAVADAIATLDRQAGFESRVQLLKGALALRSDDPARALDHLAAVPAEQELRPLVMPLTAEALYRVGRLTEAEALLRELVQEFPDHVEGHRWLGAIYYDLGAIDQAIGHVKRVAELAPDDYRPHRLMGLMYYDFEQNPEAIEQYERALALAPPQQIRDEIIRELAHSLVAEREYEQALEWLEGARPSADILALRGECYWSLGQHAEARDCLAQARQDGSESRRLDLLEAKIQLDDGAADEAISILEGALQRDPHDAECRYQLAMCFRQMGDEQRCQEELARWQVSTDLLVRLTELNIEAISNPTDAEVRDEIVEVCVQLGKTEMAEVWRRAAETCREAAAAKPQTGMIEPLMQRQDGP